jgi:arylsulfatase A-like enzyme
MKQIFDNRFYDACFRGVWEYLEARGLADNTATVVTSDHGVSFGEHGETELLHAGARPHEYLTRVPLILRFPPGTEHATLHGRRTEKVSLTDIFQTLVDLGVGPDVFTRERPVRGDSLIYRLRENEFEPVVVAESSLFPRSYRIQPEVIGYCKAVYTGSLKLIAVPDARVTDDYKALVKGRLEDSSTASTEPLAELYDLAADPHETTNLASPRAQVVEELLRLLSEWACVANSGSSETPRWSDDAVQTLRALGYLH